MIAAPTEVSSWFSAERDSKIASMSATLTTKEREVDALRKELSEAKVKAAKPVDRSEINQLNDSLKQALVRGLADPMDMINTTES